MSAQSLISQGFGGYAGWGDTEADADFRATGGRGKESRPASSSNNSGNTGSGAPFNADAGRILKESSTAAINTLQSGQAPLEQRYQDLIAGMKATGEQEVKRTDITSAQELAKRGIPLSSTYSGEYQQERRLPVQTAFQSQEAAAQLSAQQSVENRNSAIAQIQSATGLNEVNAALEGYRMSEQSRQYNETMAFSRAQAAKQDASAKDNYTTLSAGETLYNLLTGSAQYTAPKGTTPFATKFDPNNAE